MLTRPLRFAMVTTFYPPYCTNEEGHHVQRWARALSARGHRVDVIHDTDAYRLETDHAPEVTFEKDGIRVYRLRSSRKKFSTLSAKQLGRPTTHRDRLEVLLNGRYDVIHYHNISAMGGPGIWEVGTGIKLHTAHDFWLVCPNSDLWKNGGELCESKQCIRCTLSQRKSSQVWRYTQELERSATHIDAFLMQSQSAADLHVQFGFQERVQITPSIAVGAAPRLKPVSIAKPDEKLKFLFSGPLNDKQDLEQVILTFGCVPEAELRIAGDGEQTGMLKQQCEAIENVVFLGALSEGDLKVERKNASVIIVPYKVHEVLPVSIVEAFREGKPVLARDVGPNREIIQKSDGGLVFASIAELQSQIEELVRDPDQVSEMARMAFSYFARHWKEDVVIDAYFEIIRQVAEKRGFEDLIRKIDDAPTRFSVEARL